MADDDQRFVMGRVMPANSPGSLVTGRGAQQYRVGCANCDASKEASQTVNRLAILLFGEHASPGRVEAAITELVAAVRAAQQAE